MRITRDPVGESPKMQRAFQKETMRFRDLTFKKKLEYIWDYYKWYFVFAACFITIAVITVPTIIYNQKEVALYAVFLNSNIPSQDETTLMDDYVENKQIEMDNKRLVLDTSMHINRANPSEVASHSSQKMLALFASKSMDVVIEDEENVKFYAKENTYVDLRDVITEEQLSRYEPLFYTAKSGDEGETGVFAVNVTDSPVLQSDNVFDDPVYFSITVHSQQVDNALRFLDYLMGY